VVVRVGDIAPRRSGVRRLGHRPGGPSPQRSKKKPGGRRVRRRQSGAIHPAPRAAPQPRRTGHGLLTTKPPPWMGGGGPGDLAGGATVRWSGGGVSTRGERGPAATGALGCWASTGGGQNGPGSDEAGTGRGATSWSSHSRSSGMGRQRGGCVIPRMVRPDGRRGISDDRRSCRCGSGRTGLGRGGPAQRPTLDSGSQAWPWSSSTRLGFGRSTDGRLVIRRDQRDAVTALTPTAHQWSVDIPAVASREQRRVRFGSAHDGTPCSSHVQGARCPP